jgi:hypothetical protein
MSYNISHTNRLQDVLHCAGEQAKQMIDHIIGALSLELEDRANDQAETRTQQSAPAPIALAGVQVFFLEIILRRPRILRFADLNHSRSFPSIDNSAYQPNKFGSLTRAD